jgi:multiple sugar transport system ATP-binding protein
MQLAAPDFADTLQAPLRARGLTLRGVSKAFGGRTVVDELDLDVAPGEFLAIVGPSGSGKSTALRLVAGLEEPDAGEIRLGGRSMRDVPARERDVAMVFQSYALYPHLTVFRNLAAPLEIRRLPRAEIEHRVTAAAELLDIGYLLNRRPPLLSGGQRQRVALARALVREPALFLLDEPLGSLDAAARRELRAEIVRLHRRLGTTFVYVTHEQAEAMAIADRIAVLNDGRIEQVAAPQALYDHPASMFVAGFIGAPGMNLLPPGTLAAPAGRGAVVGIRPEHLGAAPLSDGLALETTVEQVEPLGAETRIGARMGEQPLVARLASRPAVRPGDRLTLWADRRALHCFDPVTGRALPGRQMEQLQ